MKTKSKRGEIVTVLCVVLAAMFLAPKVAPSIFDKRTKEASQSADASAKVELAVEKERAGRLHADGIIAASLAQMHMSWGQLNASPQRDFLDREYQYIAPLLGTPDVAAMQASYERRIAIEQGKAELADKLYRNSNEKVADLITKNAKLETGIQTSFADRREVDGKLAESAAYARGQDMVIGVVALIAVLAVALWLYTKFTSLPKIDLARMANRAREEGATALGVIDAVVPDAWHDGIDRLATRLREEEARKKGGRKAAAEAADRS